MDNTLVLFGVETSWVAVLTAATCGASGIVLLFKWFRNQKINKEIQKARTRRDATLQQAAYAVSQFMDSHSITDTSQILSLPMVELIKKLKDGSLSPEIVLHAYMEKTLEVNKRINCCTEILLESFDDIKNIGGSKEGLLYGVPMSIKEHVGIKGHDSTCGVICKLHKPVPEDSVLVKVLKMQGAIPFAKTNVPQSLLNYDCSNPIFGQTVNPHNPLKTPGGSSGGEGALIGGGGALLGLGTDIGGSIRIPSSFCGICGLKPTPPRLSAQGIDCCSKGQNAVLFSTGPMAQDVDSLALCMRALLCDDLFKLDPNVPPVPFNQQVYESSKPLRIGYFETDGYQMASPSMRRGVREVKALLEKAGHSLVPYSCPRLSYAIHELIILGIFGDGGSTVFNHMKDGPIDPCLGTQKVLYSLPHPVKKLIALLLKPLFPRVASFLKNTCGLSSVQDMWKTQAAIEDYRREVIAEWRKCEMDVLLCPVLGPAFNFNNCGKLTCAVSYTVIYNLLNFPAGVVPVSKVTDEDEEELKHYKGHFGDPWDKQFVKAVSGAVGLPVAVQCVSLPWQDELCLRFMKEVETLVKENK